MVYRIEGEFSDETFPDIIEKIEKNFVFIYSKSSLYVAIKKLASTNDIKLLEKKLHTVFKKYKDPKYGSNLYSIIKITDKNLSEEAPELRQWCRDNFVRLESQLYELNEQDSLHKVWKQMDLMEDELSSELKELNK